MAALSACCALTGQTQTPAAVPWSTISQVASELRQNVVEGALIPAQMRSVEIGMLLQPGNKTAGTVANQIAEVEGRSTPGDKDPSLTLGLVPGVDRLLKAVGENDSQSTIIRLRELSASISEALRVRGMQRRAKVAGTGEGTALELQARFENALHRNDAAAAGLAAQLQAVLESKIAKHEAVADYGFYLYAMNDARGRAAFVAGDYETAGDFLQKAADSAAAVEPTVRLDYFGPNFWLAGQLLHVGKREVVLQFLQTVRQKIWTHDADNLDGWITDMRLGKTPEFRPNALDGYAYMER
jgi:hypothetical protein